MALFVAMSWGKILCAEDALQLGDELPSLQGESLTGTTVELPGSAAGKPAFLIFTFSKTGGSSAKGWSDRFTKDYSSNPRIQFFSCMFLQSVPRLFRGLVSSGIKKGIPTSLQPFTIRIYQDQEMWEKFFHVTDRDQPFLALLDSSKRMVWNARGIFSQQLYSTLQQEIQKLLQ